MTQFCVAMIQIDGESTLAPNAWDCYVINLNEEPVRDVLIRTKGYGQSQGVEIRSSTLRYFYTQIGAQEATLLEIIQPELVSLKNEF